MLSVKVFVSLLAMAFSASAQSSLCGLTYNPKRSDGSCPTLDDIKSDISALKDTTSILRIYSLVDCDQGDLILEAIQGTEMKVNLGMWVGSDDATFQKELDTLDTLAKKYALNDNVLSVVVGNDPISDGMQTPAQIAEKLKKTKDVLEKDGYGNVSVTAAEKHFNYTPEVMSEVDFVMANGFPFWQGQDAVTSANSLLTSLDGLTARSNGKMVVVGQTGWPSDGDSIRDAVADPDSAFAYLQAFVCGARARNMDYIYFSGHDEPWKHEARFDPFNVEGSFGILNADLTPKFADRTITC
ncbi:Glucan 1,3-beta-glucosidase [Zancudomyces culisetae]|uniref:glucan endo-1,3-beta-D-glucosidase n=1 Tax=Zancudomyces culisetae TaxID=1213189 RepID=A0A1R1PNR2_ZANCU|nr:Glucan 1,3-beta-glucosidase [Zancudomyces culisetae]|eukprot:OMH82543.1 Glucan 1,3-beta-glucosidase [Zancudomyces culisetae]